MRDINEDRFGDVQTVAVDERMGIVWLRMA